LPLILKQKLKDCDIIVLDFPYLYPIATRSSKPAFLNAHNAEYELYKSNNYLSSIVKKIEIKAIKDVEQVLFCNEDDQNKFIKYVSNITNKSLIVPNGTDQGHIRRNNITRSDLRKKINITNDQHVFLFTGSQYAPNQEACKFLRSWCKENKEEIQDLDIVFLIVGSADREILSEPYLKVIGIVDDVAPYFLASDFGINPVVMGSGSNVKMVEYLTATLPIISTSFGSRGLNLEDKKTYWNLKRDYMLCTLKEAIAHPLEQRYQMAQLALHNNISKVDMSMSIESLMLKW
jgi:glycosyltransferase involved in cell wall biosynthesis